MVLEISEPYSFIVISMNFIAFFYFSTANPFIKKEKNTNKDNDSEIYRNINENDYHILAYVSLYTNKIHYRLFSFLRVITLSILNTIKNKVKPKGVVSTITIILNFTQTLIHISSHL